MEGKKEAFLGTELPQDKEYKEKAADDKWKYL